MARLLLIVLAVLLFVPKINLVEVPGFTIQAKPEDAVWLMMMPLLAWRPLRLDTPVHKAWSLLLLYLVVSALWHPSNAVMVLRLFFYSFPLLYGMNLSPAQMLTARTMTRRFLYLFVVIAALQVLTPFPYFHTGELLLGPVDRAPGIFGNGVEFALVAFFAFWFLRALGERSALPWMAALAITFFSGTRMATLMLLVGGLVFVRHWPWQRTVVIIALMAAVGSIASALTATPDTESRVAEVDPFAVVTAFREVLSAAGASSGFTVDEGYCFEFDNTLAEDQSLAMRLSKLLFVVENVVLGSHPLGFGLGQCIGDAGDNLYVRVLSDAGLPYLAVVLLFFGSVLTLRRLDRDRSFDWRVFAVTLVLVSSFYDTLYFSRVAPLFFATLAVVLQRRSPKAGRTR